MLFFRVAVLLLCFNCNTVKLVFLTFLLYLQYFSTFAIVVRRRQVRETPRQFFEPLGVEIEITLKVSNRSNVFFHLVENVFHFFLLVVRRKSQGARGFHNNIVSFPNTSDQTCEHLIDSCQLVSNFMQIIFTKVTKERRKL